MAASAQGKKIGQGCGCLLVIFIVGAFVVSFFDKSPPSPPEATAAFVCGDFVKHHLRDPDSAEIITDLTAMRAIRQADGSYTTLLRARANNGFGGKTVALFSCTVTRDANGDWDEKNVGELGSD